MAVASTSSSRVRQGLARSARLLRTVSTLKPVQIYGRLLTRLPARGGVPLTAPAVRAKCGRWIDPIERPRCLTGRWQMRFLNETGEIASAAQWNDPGKAKLWLYNLHYFDDLAVPGTTGQRAMQRELVTRWIAENPIGSGNGWEPYPTSLRIVNWIKWALGGEQLDAGMLDSLSQQVRWLCRRIEWHLLGNHLFANAKALIFAGCFFEGREAETWLDKGLAILARELDEQVLEDGAHFERSPMYHAIILEDVLDLYDAALAFGIQQRKPVDRLPAVANRMRVWLAAMTHPDGGPSFFNDSAFAIAPAQAALEAYAARLGLPEAKRPVGVQYLRSSGYARLDCGPAALIADIGEIGPGYLPGHAHADTLSFELSLGRDRLIVNSGTSTYATGDLRAYQRSTAAHSTIGIDGENSSEVWSSFRVGRRARVHHVVVAEEDGTFAVSAAHDGYRWLPGKPTHHRLWQLGEGRLVVVDKASSTASHACQARFHLGAGVAATIVPNGRVGTLKLSDGRSIEWRASERATLVPGHFYPEFGRAIANTCLVVPFTKDCRTEFVWST